MEGVRELAEAGVADPLREARRLWALALGEPLWTATASAPLVLRRRFHSLLAARVRRVPLAYLEGEVAFLDFELRVGPGVFIPRPETEELAERAGAAFRRLAVPSFLDLGTGTGALALALARARPEAWGVAVDTSRRALRCAQANARRLGVADQISFRRSHWYEAVPERFALVVANPPYVAVSAAPLLPPEVRRYEPRRAWCAGPTGLEAIREVIVGAPDHLLLGGFVFVEIGEDQGPATLEIARGTQRYTAARVEKDLAGKDRFFIGQCG